MFGAIKIGIIKIKMVKIIMANWEKNKTTRKVMFGTIKIGTIKIEIIFSPIYFLLLLMYFQKNYLSIFMNGGKKRVICFWYKYFY